MSDKYEGTHSCGPHCERVPCLKKRIAELEAKHTALLDGLQKIPRYNLGAQGGIFPVPVFRRNKNGTVMRSEDVLALIGDEE